jgi:hypothetical protein
LNAGSLFKNSFVKLFKPQKSFCGTNCFAIKLGITYGFLGAPSSGAFFFFSPNIFFMANKACKSCSKAFGKNREAQD